MLSTLSKCACCGMYGELMLQCSKCRTAMYCNKDCQREHWKYGGHKKMCGKHVKKIVNDPVFPCPICLCNEDTMGHNCMCTFCGQQFCEECAVDRTLSSCPVCRKENPWKFDFDRFDALARKREFGHHSPGAWSRLGFMYYTGEGVETNYKEAVKWIQKAADVGVLMALCLLGDAYYNGCGVEQDTKKSLQLYLEASKTGISTAYSGLGCQYMLEHKYESAYHYHTLAVRGGHGISYFELGELCYYGEGTKKNLQRAFFWYKKRLSGAWPEVTTCWV